MKKICFVTTVSMTVRAFILPLLRHLTENTDWKITVICDDDPSLKDVLPDGVQYIPVSMKRGISLSGIGAVAQMAKIFRREKFDLVQYSTPNASLYASLAAKLAGVPVRLYCQWGLAYVAFQGMKRKIFKGVEKLVCSLSTWVEPDSFGNLRFCQSEGLYKEKKSSVIWNGSASGVNLEKFDISQKPLWRQEIREKLGIAEDAFVYGFIGRITGDKGINELFRAYQNLIKEQQNTYLILAGLPEKEETLNPQLYDWAKKDPHVLFCGFTTQVERYMAAMDVYILPSYREGFGSAVVEAEAMGVPVIVTDIPGPTDALVKDETGLVVKKADWTSLYDAMLQIKTDATMRKNMGQAAYELARGKFEQTQLLNHIVEDRKRLMKISK